MSRIVGMTDQLDVLVAERSDGVTMHITKYDERGLAFGYLLKDGDRREDVPYPLMSVVRNDPTSWEGLPALEDNPLLRDPK